MSAPLFPAAVTAASTSRRSRNALVPAAAALLLLLSLLSCCVDGVHADCGTRGVSTHSSTTAHSRGESRPVATERNAERHHQRQQGLIRTRIALLFSTQNGMPRVNCKICAHSGGLTNQINVSSAQPRTHTRTAAAAADNARLLSFDTDTRIQQNARGGSVQICVLIRWVLFLRVLCLWVGLLLSLRATSLFVSSLCAGSVRCASLRFPSSNHLSRFR